VEVVDTSESGTIAPVKSKTSRKQAGRSEQLEEVDTAAVGYTAIVVGGTGAVGRYLVSELLESDRWEKVVVLGRRSGVPDYYPASEKLVEVVCELDGMCESTSVAWQAFAEHQPHAAFCCLGTTMAQAKTKAGFKRVDWHYVTDFAWLARRWRVASFSLISSVGASASSAFLYPRTKGKSEDYVKSLNFPFTLIYRPGLLGRDYPTKIEVWYGKIASILPAPFFGKVMAQAPLEIMDAHPLITLRTPDEAGVIWKESWDNDKIYKFAKHHNIPKQKYVPKGKKG
jgi:oxidoreductase